MQMTGFFSLDCMLMWGERTESTDYQMQNLKAKIVGMVLMAKSQPNGVFDNRSKTPSFGCELATRTTGAL
jgi:hypothetical protein